MPAGVGRFDRLGGAVIGLVVIGCGSSASSIDRDAETLNTVESGAEGGAEDSSDALDAVGEGDEGQSVEVPSGGFYDAFVDVGPIGDPLDGASGCDGGLSYAGPQCAFAIPFYGGLSGVLESGQPVQ